ncbi:hypothetical protein [Croceicoccus sp. Ery15]|uniref:hypothetical protein n=1 Tax=Croceicoccus sp. Ery15 TaxID=1703338 RepID=UPI001E48D0FA|nr:hypothetical protein [Croceicoccus sp. Ery15]
MAAHPIQSSEESGDLVLPLLRLDNQSLAHALQAIGIPVTFCLDAEGFLEDVRIEAGGLRCKPDADPANILHEAGHLAILPPVLRSRANDDLGEIVEALEELYEAKANDPEWIDSPLMQATLQISDPEATAWAFAFGTACGYSPDQIIQDDQYDGEGDGVRFMLVQNQYLGVHGLRAAGFIDRVSQYPHLKMWTQDAA